LVARPPALAPWLGIPKDLGSEAGITGLIASLRPDGASLAVELAVARAAVTPATLAGADLAGDLAGDLPGDLVGEPSEDGASAPAGEGASDPGAELAADIASDVTADSAFDGDVDKDVDLGGAVAKSPLAPLSAPSALYQEVGAELLAHLRGEASSLALLNDPRQLLGLLQPLWDRSLGAASGPLPGLVMAADSGPLLWAEGRDGWLLGTAAGEPAPGDLEPALAAQGLIAAPLTLTDGRPSTVWTRLAAPAPGRRGAGDGRQLQAELLGVRTVDADLAWWAHGLDRLRQQAESRRQPRARLKQLQAIDRPAAARLAVDGPQARRMLQQWSSWRLLSGLAGAPLGDAVQGLSLALAPEVDGLRLMARLDLG
jgi:hypothetical protein